MQSRNTKVQRINYFPKISQRFNATAFCEIFEDASVIVKASASQIDYPPHWGVMSVKCAFNGTEYYQFKNCRYAVNDQHFMLFNSGSYRASVIDSNVPVDSFTISFTGHMEKDVAKTFLQSATKQLDDPFEYNDNELRVVEKLYRHDKNPCISAGLVDLFHNLDGFDEALVAEKLYDILEGLALTQEHLKKDIASLPYVKHSTKLELYERLSRSRDFIISNFRDDIRLEQMADVACLNLFYFLREFKKAFGVTPYKFLQTIRLQRARTLLAFSDMSVTEVCHEVGFFDVASFSKLFKKTFLITPGNAR